MAAEAPQAGGDGAAADGPAPQSPARAYRRYVLWALTLVYTFNFVDRQLIAILSPAIKEELGLSDSVLGLLKGLAFAVLYTTLGIPIAWLADRWNRVSIISIALALWSGFTALSGLAANAAQLIAARIGVGLGEAGCSPPAHSLLSDYFPKEERAGALGIYSLGIPFGQMFAFLAGGWVLENLGWRNAFFIVGVPGVILALIFKLTVREPIRGAQEGASAPPPVPFREALARLAAIPSFWIITIAVTLASFTGYGVVLWVVDFYRRTYELSYTEITVPLALLNGVAYGIGTALGGFLTDRAAKRNVRAYGLIPALGMAATIPTLLLLLWAPSALFSFLWSAPFLIGIGMYLGPGFSLVQTLAPIRVRATATAIFFFVLNLVALGLAPVWVGGLSDLFAATHGETTGLRYAMSTLVVFSAASVAAFWYLGKRLPVDWARAEQGGGLYAERQQDGADGR